MEYGLLVPEKLVAFTKRAPIGKTLKEETHSSAGELISYWPWVLALIWGRPLIFLLEEICYSDNRVNFSVRFVS